MYDMILHYTIDIQKREDANRCSSYVELVNFETYRILKQQIMILFSGTMK
jgi:hypothetical protein